MILRKGIISSSEKGLKYGWTREPFIFLRKDYVEKIRPLTYWERKKIKEAPDEALGPYVNEKD